MTPNSEKSIPHTPTSSTLPKPPPASPLYQQNQTAPQPHPYTAASPASFVPYSIAATSITSSTSSGPEQEPNPSSSSHGATPNAYTHQDKDLPAPPSSSANMQDSHNYAPGRHAGHLYDIIAPLSPQPKLKQRSPKEDNKHRHEISISLDTKSLQASNPNYAGNIGDFSVRKPVDLATIPASPAAMDRFESTKNIPDAEPPQIDTCPPRRYSSHYGPPSPTSHYAPSHAPSESIYSTKFRLDDEFSVTNFARDIGLMGASGEMYIDDEELEITIGDLGAHEPVSYQEPMRMHHYMNSESTQGSRSSGFNASSVSTAATSIGRGNSQDLKESTLALKAQLNYEGMDSPTDPFFADGRLSNPSYNGDHKVGSSASRNSTRTSSASALEDVPEKPTHRTQKSSVSSVASRFKANRRCSAGHSDNRSPIITHFPIPPCTGPLLDIGMIGRKPSKPDSISSLRNGGIGSPVDGSSNLEQEIRKLTNSPSDSVTTIPRNDRLPTPNPSVEKLSACQEVPETQELQEPESKLRPKPEIEGGMKRESQENLKPGPLSPVKTDVTTPAASGTVSPSPTSPSRPRVRNRCRGCNEFIVGKSVSSADGRLTGRWHRKCFRCTKCQEPFATGDFYVHDNQPYCSQHYHELNGSLCAACNSGIEGTYLETEGIQEENDSWGTESHLHPAKSQSLGSINPPPASQEQKKGNKYHPECFKCTTCRIVLRGDYFEWNGLPYCERDSRVAAGLPLYSDPTPPPMPRSNTWNAHHTPDSGHQGTYRPFQSQPAQPPATRQHPPMGLAPIDTRRPTTPNFQPQAYHGPSTPGFRRPGPGPFGPPGPPPTVKPRGPPPPRPPRPGYTPAVPFQPPPTPTRLPPQRGVPPGSEFDCREEIGGDFGPFMPGRVPYGRGPGPVAGGTALPMPVGAAGPGGSPYPPSRRFPERRTTKLSFI